MLKHLRAAYLEQLEETYDRRGYETTVDFEIESGIRIDFLAVHDTSAVAYEIKTGRFTTEQRSQLHRIRTLLKEHYSRAEMKLVILNPPQSLHIEIEDIEIQLLSDITEEGIPDELDQLSTHTEIHEVTGVGFDWIKVERDCIVASGTGQVSVLLVYGSESDHRRGDGAEWAESFPFRFDITLDRDLRVVESDYHFDTDSFFE